MCKKRLKKHHIRQINDVYDGAYDTYASSNTKSGGFIIYLPKKVSEQLRRGPKASTQDKEDKSGGAHILQTRSSTFRALLLERLKSGKALLKKSAVIAQKAAIRRKRKLQHEGVEDTAAYSSTSITKDAAIIRKRTKRVGGGGGDGDGKKKRNILRDDNAANADTSDTAEPLRIPKALRGLPPALLRRIQAKEKKKAEQNKKLLYEKSFLGLHALPQLYRMVRAYFATEKHKTAEYVDILVQNLVASRNYHGIRVCEKSMAKRLVLLAKTCEMFCSIDPPFEETCASSGQRRVFRVNLSCDTETTEKALAGAIEKARLLTAQ